MRKLLVIASFLAALLPCGPGLGFPAALASGTGESGATPQALFQGSGKDVAVDSVVQVGPPFVREGNVVTINIGVTNKGDSEETFLVSLRDDTEDKEIGSRQVTLAAGGFNNCQYCLGHYGSLRRAGPARSADTQGQSTR